MLFPTKKMELCHFGKIMPNIYSLNLDTAMDKIYQRNSFSRQLCDALIPDLLFLVNSLICLNCHHKLFTYYIKCRLANNLCKQF